MADLRRGGAAHDGLRSGAGVGAQLHTIVHTSQGGSSDVRLDSADEVDRFGVLRRRSGIRGALRRRAVNQPIFPIEARRRRQDVAKSLEFTGIPWHQRRADGDAWLMSELRERVDRRRPA